MTACRANKQRMMCAHKCVCLRVCVCVHNLYAAQAETLLTTKNFSSFIMQDEMLAAMSVKHCTHWQTHAAPSASHSHTRTDMHSLYPSAPSLPLCHVLKQMMMIDLLTIATLKLSSLNSPPPLALALPLSLFLFIFLPLSLPHSLSPLHRTIAHWMATHNSLIMTTKMLFSCLDCYCCCCCCNCAISYQFLKFYSMTIQF